MSYFSLMEAGLKIKKGKVDELQAQVKKLLILPDNKKPGFVQSFLKDMRMSAFISQGRVVEDRYLEWDDYYQKWDEAEDFAVFIAPYVEENCRLVFTGEDGEKSGYVFRGGAAFDLQFIERVGKKLS